MPQLNEEIDIDGCRLRVAVLRTARKKSIAIELSRRHEIIIRAPHHASTVQIKKSLASCLPWLTKRMRLLKEQARVSGPVEFVSGKIFFILGSRKCLEVVRENKGRAVVAENAEAITVQIPADEQRTPSAEQVRAVLVSWYCSQAAAVIPNRVRFFSSLVGVAMPPVRINGARKRWGSCGATGRLNFPWRLVMAPLELIDYVVVHELCHLKRRDHSPQFWLLVEKVMPDYRERKRRLRDDAHLYDF